MFAAPQVGASSATELELLVELTSMRD